MFFSKRPLVGEEIRSTLQLTRTDGELTLELGFWIMGVPWCPQTAMVFFVADFQGTIF